MGSQQCSQDIDQGEAASTEKDELPLHSAAADGELERLQSILTDPNAHVNGTDAEGRTALHVACGSGNIDAVQTPLNNGASVWHQDKNGQLPMHAAAKAESIATVKTLVQLGGVTQAKEEDNHGYIPWSFAQTDEMASLLARGLTRALPELPNICEGAECRVDAFVMLENIERLSLMYKRCQRVRATVKEYDEWTLRAFEVQLYKLYENGYTRIRDASAVSQNEDLQDLIQVMNNLRNKVSAHADPNACYEKCVFFLCCGGNGKISVEPKRLKKFFFNDEIFEVFRSLSRFYRAVIQRVMRKEERLQKLPPQAQLRNEGEDLEIARSYRAEANESSESRVVETYAPQQGYYIITEDMVCQRNQLVKACHAKEDMRECYDGLTQLQHVDTAEGPFLLIIATTVFRLYRRAFDHGAIKVKDLDKCFRSRHSMVIDAAKRALHEFGSNHPLSTLHSADDSCWNCHCTLLTNQLNNFKELVEHASQKAEEALEKALNHWRTELWNTAQRSANITMYSFGSSA